MFENIEKLPLYFLALFHGIITAYIVYVLTDLDFSETYFVLFVVFCSLINVILVRLVLTVWLLPFLLRYRLALSSTKDDATHRRIAADIARTRTNLSRLLNFSPDDLLLRPNALYFVLCVAVGILSGYVLATAYQMDWLLQAFSVTGWPKHHDRNPMEQFFWQYCNNFPNTCSKVQTAGQSQSSSQQSDPDSAFNYEYMRIWWKDGKLVTAGFLSEVPGRKEKPVVKLYAACELIIKQDYSGESVYAPDTRDPRDFTQFIDLSNPNILFIEIVHSKNPCPAPKP